MTEQQFIDAMNHHVNMMVAMAADVRDTIKSEKTPIIHLTNLVDVSGKLMIAHLNAVEKIAEIIQSYHR